MFEDGEIDEGQMFERCFPKMKKMDQGVSNKGRRSLIDFLCKLFGKRVEISCIECNLCGNNIGIKQRKGKSFKFDSIITHACVHAGVKPFKCRRCESSFRMRDNVRAHFKRVHGTKPTNQDIEYQSERFHDEIWHSIKRCFTECKDGAPPSNEIKRRTRQENAARCRMVNRSELAVQRQLFFNRTIKKNVNSDWKVTCRLCSMMVSAKHNVGPNGGDQFSSQGAVYHAQHHLRKPLYRCRECSKSRNTSPNMRDHLKEVHALGMENNYECFDDKFHSDILVVFAKCFEED